jgi:hypothetical protein
MEGIQQLKQNRRQAIKRNEYVAAAHTKFRDDLTTTSQVVKRKASHASARIWCGSSDKRNAGYLQTSALRSRYVTRRTEYRRWRCSSNSDRLQQSPSWFSVWFNIHLHWLTHLTLDTQLFKKWKRLQYNKSVTSRRRILITAKNKRPQILNSAALPCTHTPCIVRWTGRHSFPYPVQFIIIILLLLIIIIIIAVIVK